MKKLKGKLSLDRETLVVLHDAVLDGVNGGNIQTGQPQSQNMNCDTVLCHTRAPFCPEGR